jgi:hypothetical protein
VSRDGKAMKFHQVADVAPLRSRTASIEQILRTVE